MNKVKSGNMFQKPMESFIREVELKGYKALHIKQVFKEFDAFLVINHPNISVITEFIYREWFETTIELDKHTRYQKASIIVRFTKYLVSLGIECYIPPIPRSYRNDFIPHIYSKDEIGRLFKACDSLRTKERVPSTSLMVLPVLIRLLYSTGIRIGEALSIKNRDVDFNRHVITLNITKNGRQRYAPINSSMEEVLKQYISYRDRMPIADLTASGNYLFVSCIGRPIVKNVISRWFILALKAAEIPYKGNRQGPRIHDLRHSAAIHAFEQLISSGKDAYCCIPVIAQFLGHTSSKQSEHYLRLTAAMYPELLKLDNNVTSDIIKIDKILKYNNMHNYGKD